MRPFVFLGKRSDVLIVSDPLRWRAACIRSVRSQVPDRDWGHSRSEEPPSECGSGSSDSLHHLHDPAHGACLDAARSGPQLLREHIERDSGISGWRELHKGEPEGPFSSKSRPLSPCGSRRKGDFIHRTRPKERRMAASDGYRSRHESTRSCTSAILLGISFLNYHFSGETANKGLKIS